MVTDADRVAEAATRAVARFWYAEAKKIEEQIIDPQARWAILTTAMLRVGWPEKEGDRA